MIDETAKSNELFANGEGHIALDTMTSARMSVSKLGEVPSAFWVDRKAKISKSRSGGQTMESILQDAASS
eukprot:6450245-Prymnesium_polylepis.1